MKTFKILLIILISFHSTSHAATYYIQSAGDDTNTGTNIASPWKTIAKANSTMIAGDTVYIRAGTYLETINPTGSGNAGNYITYASYESENVVLSPTGLGADLRNTDYIILDGLHFFETGDKWVDVEGGEHNIIQNCIMDLAKSGYTGINLRLGANYNKVLNNTLISRCPCSSGCTYQGGPADIIRIDSSGYNLIEGNIMTGGTHDAIDMQDSGTDGATNYNVIRNNTIQNKMHSNIDVWGVEYLLFENNIVVDAGEERTTNWCGSEGDRAMPDIEHKGIMMNTKYSIIRNNTTVNNGVGISNASSYTTWKGMCADNRFYNNTITKNLVGIRRNDPASESSFDNVFKNNAIHDSTSYNVYIWDKESGKIDYYINNNLSGTPENANNWSNYDVVTNTTTYLPLFTSELTRDFTLQEGSDLIDAGAFLTLTSGSGSGTSIVVDDANYFFDGWGITTGDIIQLSGQTTTATITNVNYSTNTLTVDTTLTWTDNLGVSLAYNGTGPDIGAKEYIADIPPEDPVTPIAVYFEAEAMSLISPLVVGDDVNASGGYYVWKPTGTNSTTPIEEGTTEFNIAEIGTYYLWVAINGVRGERHALYVGIDSTWDRVYPVAHGIYDWIRVEVTSGSANYAFSLSAGSHTLRLGHGEIEAKADMFFLTSDPEEIPTEPQQESRVSKATICDTGAPIRVMSTGSVVTVTAE